MTPSKHQGVTCLFSSSRRELNEVYTGLWGPTATFLPDDVAYDFFHGLKNGARPMLQEIFRKEGELKGEEV
jgi:hypothetical protein